MEALYLEKYGSEEVKLWEVEVEIFFYEMWWGI